MKTNRNSTILIFLAVCLVVVTFLQSFAIMLSFRIQPAESSLCVVRSSTLASVAALEPRRLPTDANRRGTIDTAWCLLDENNTRLVSGIPHAMQSLGLCWSYFCRVREIYGEAIRCGLHLSNYAVWEQASNVGPRRKGWVSDLLHSMNCTISATIPHDDVGVDRFVQHRPPLNATSWKQMFVWFERPSDATMLTKSVLGPAAVTLRASQRPLQIGLVQRIESRVFTNFDQIASSIQQAFPDTHVETAVMENMTFRQQAQFWNDKDVVVVGHGAAVTNAVFMRRGASIVEVYPPHYYPRIYEALCRRIGLRHYAWYDNVTDIDHDHATHGKTMRQRKRLRTESLSPPVDKIVDLVRQAINSAMFVWEIDERYL
jgi:Glycosyltransferase 61